MKQATGKAKQLAALVVGAVLVSGFGNQLSAAPRGKAAPKSAQDIVQAQQELLIAECKLNDEQQKTIKEKFKAKLEALEAWNKANADKVKAAEEAAQLARKGTDASAKKKAMGDVKELEGARAKALEAVDKAILDVLTDDMKATWAGVELAQTTLPHYKKANLTDEQTAKIKAACILAAKDLASYSGDDKKSKQGKVGVHKSLSWAIENVILTADQRATATHRPARK